MESNLCDVKHLDSNVLLPPRKRLLAGLKKQNLDVNFNQPSTSSEVDEFDSRLNNLTSYHLKNPNLSLQDIVEASRTAAAAAIKVAEAVRAVAEEKAVIAAKAMAAAKSALDLVATISEEADSAERHLKKNKIKKHLPVKMFYNKHRPVENCKKDEELARKLHQAINSSPRISKTSSNSDLKTNKHKRLKVLSTPEKTRVTSNGHGETGDVDSEGSTHETYTVRVNENILKLNRQNSLKIYNGEAESSHSKERNFELSDDLYSIGRKRGRMKQKKLPLSICSFRDQATPKEELKPESSPSTEENVGKPPLNNTPSSSADPSFDGKMPVKTASMWKCQALKAPVCVKQNKVMES